MFNSKQVTKLKKRLDELEHTVPKTPGIIREVGYIKYELNRIKNEQ